MRATLASEDGTLISNIPLAELIRVPARVFDDSTDFERRSLGEIVGGKPPAPLPGPKGKFGATLPGAMVLYRPSANKKDHRGACYAEPARIQGYGGSAVLCRGLELYASAVVSGEPPR